MGYKIVYAKEKIEKGHILRRILLTMAFFALFLFLVQRSWPEGALRLRQLLIPQAIENLASYLGRGEGIGEAVAAFCQELTDGR